MVRVAALVVNYGTPDDLEACVRSSLQHEDLKWALFDNPHPRARSTERSQDLARGIEGVWATTDQNRGHGYGINQLAKHAVSAWDPQYFFIVNPDCLWVEPIVERLVNFLEEDPIRAMVGPKQLDSRFRITSAGIFGTNEKPQHRLWHVHDPRNLQAKDRVEAVMIPGSAILISAADFFAFGGLLEARHYYSETFLAYHLRAHGRTVWYYGEATLVHEWHRSTPVGSPITDGMFDTDRALFRKMCDEHDPPIPRD